MTTRRPYPTIAMHHTLPLLAPSLLAAFAFLSCASTPSSDPKVSAATEARMHGKMQFAILMYETNDAWHRLPVAERDALMKKY
ncbi:MAG: hypothetical protein ACKO3W_10535, partial [bacterium]